MIDSKELMIFNWVKVIDKDGDFSFKQVKSIDDKGINYFVSQSGYEYEALFESTDKYDWFWVEPIPLTPTILEQCGFTKSLNHTCYGMITKDGKDRFSIFEDGRFKFHVEDLSVKIKYLHELQNLYYSLTGSELNIQL